MLDGQQTRQCSGGFAMTWGGRVWGRVVATAVVLVVAAGLGVTGPSLSAGADGEGGGDERLAGACPDNMPGAGFEDVDGGAHARAVDCVAWWEVSVGDGAGRYRPAADIRRDQIASMLARLAAAAGRPVPPGDAAGFDDVDGNVHAEAVGALAGSGVIRGVSTSRFAPAAPVRRDQMASLLVRLHAALFDPLPAGQARFDDVEGNIHAAAIGSLAAAGVTGGVAPKTYDPAGRVTRAQMASFLMRLLALWVREGLVAVVADDDPDLRAGNAASHSPSVSASGRYIAFASQAGDLVDGPAGRGTQVYVRDRATGTTALVSSGAEGAAADAPSAAPSISADGRHVAFVSHATNLVAGRVVTGTNVYVTDRRSGTTMLVSAAAGGVAADGPSGTPAISADGRHVAFTSTATNLVAGDTNDAADVFVHDRDTAATTRVSVSDDGGQADAPSQAPSISGDGRLVVFSSDAATLVPGDTNGDADVFVHDRAAATTQRLSTTRDGGQADGPSHAPTIAPNGHTVAYETAAPALLADAANPHTWHIIHVELATRHARVVTAHVDRASHSPVVADDGRVAFVSTGTNVSYPPPDRTFAHVYEWRPFDNRHVLLSTHDLHGQANEPSRQPAISANGEVVAYTTPSTSLVPGTAARLPNVYAHTWHGRLCIAILISALPFLLGGDQPPGHGGTEDDRPSLLYRGGPSTAMNFTPRPNKDTDNYPNNGVSLFSELVRACEGRKKVQALDPAMVMAAHSQHLRLAPDPNDAKHFYLQADTWPRPLDWAMSRRETMDVSDHPLTTAAISAIVAEDLPC